MSRNPLFFSSISDNHSEEEHGVRVPCHRVVRSDGGLGGFSRGLEQKVLLLRGEGVVVEKGKVIVGEEGYWCWEDGWGWEC